MGVTIHFEGQLTDGVALHNLVTTALDFARDRGWNTEPIEADEVTLLRVRDEVDWNYIGPVRGVSLYPHIDCEPVRLEFDRDLYIQEFTKTQFAGATTHLHILELLKSIEPYFRKLTIEDEGEYWETSDIQILLDHISRNQKVIDEAVQKDPSVRTKVRTPSGRIIDIIS